LHVAHILIDGGINGEKMRSVWPDALAKRGEDGLLDIAAIAEAYWQLHLLSDNHLGRRIASPKRFPNR